MIINNKKDKIILRNQSQQGYAILELLFYIVLFSILSLLVINAIITMTRSFREIAIQAELARGGLMVERISREIREAYSINSIGANNLKLNTKDDAGANKTVEFLLVDSNIELLENDVLTGNLNTPNIIVTGLSFTQITTAQGKAVKMSFTVQSKNDVANRSVDFYNTIVLRGSY